MVRPEYTQFKMHVIGEEMIINFCSIWCTIVGVNVFIDFICNIHIIEHEFTIGQRVTHMVLKLQAFLYGLVCYLHEDISVLDSLRC